MQDEHPQLGRLARELGLDPAVAAAADLAVVEIGLRRVDGDDGHALAAEHRVAVAEQLLEVHVADVPRVVVAGDDDERVALDPVEVALRGGVLLLEPEGRQIAGADDDVGRQVVDLRDRPLHQIRHEVRRTAVQIGQLGDRQRHAGDSRWLTGEPSASEGGATLIAVVPETPVFQAYCGSDQPRFANPAELEYAKVLDWYGIPWAYEPTTFVLERDEQGRVVEAFTPDFYLPDQDLYLEVTVMKQSLVTRKNRKLRKLREQYPQIKIKLFYERDFNRLAARFGLQKAS